MEIVTIPNFNDFGYSSAISLNWSIKFDELIIFANTGRHIYPKAIDKGVVGLKSPNIIN